ncbi:metal cation symporter ZIP8-like [Clupea harengus]|uniref:Metal cation symporter ZIP8-like n=1 Tax=Clupea harengus TaxID=7950 RepID=A0A6P3WD70_CLUHA|nr:metal cation symporter ZIP8-like [Clupea harengus]
MGEGHSHPRANKAVVFFGVLFTFVCSVSGETPVIFNDILQFYGENGSLTHADINNLLELLNKKPSNLGGIVSTHSQCLSGAEVLSQYGLSNLTHLGEAHLHDICPALLNQAVLPSCPDDALMPEVRAVVIDARVWGFGFLSITIINLASLLGLFLIPFTKKSYFPKILTYFIGLAIGTLFSNAVLQLIPEALGFDPRVDNYTGKAVGIFGGFYLLFFVEKVLKMALKTDRGHGHSHFIPPDSPQLNSHQNGNVAEKAEVIAVTSFGRDSSDRASMTSEAHATQTVVGSRRSCHWLRGADLSSIKTVAWMITLSDGLHNFIDGLAIGASFTVSLLAGFSTSIAIVCEEFPHELGDFVILLNSGMSIPQAIFFNLLSAMACYVGLVIGILIGSQFAPNVIFAIAGGMFLYIALADMFPEMNSIEAMSERSTKSEVIIFLIQNAGILSGFAIILLITMFAGDINLG